MICMEVVAERRDTEDKDTEGTRRKGMEKQCEDSYRYEEMILRMTYRDWCYGTVLRPRLWRNEEESLLAE